MLVALMIALPMLFLCCSYTLGLLSCQLATLNNIRSSNFCPICYLTGSCSGKQWDWSKDRNYVTFSMQCWSHLIKQINYNAIYQCLYCNYTSFNFDFHCHQYLMSTDVNNHPFITYDAILIVKSSIWIQVYDFFHALQFDNWKMKRNLTKSSLGGVSSQLASKENEIQSLKQEVFQLKDLQYDLFRLNDQITNIEAKYTMVLDEKDRNESLLKCKMNINKKNLEGLQIDVQTIKNQIDEATLDVANLRRDNGTLQRNCDNKENQIMNLTVALKELEKTNEGKVMQMKATEEALLRIKQHKGKMEEDCEKLCKKLNDNRDMMKELEKQTKNQIIIQKSMTSTLENLQQQGGELTAEMRIKQNVLRQTSDHHQKLLAEVKQLSEFNQKMERECKLVQQSYTELTKSLQGCQRGNEDKIVKIKELQISAMKCDEELSKSVIKKDGLMKEHSEMATKNKELNLEIDDCLMKILQLESVNKTLQKQIETYINCDQEARILLDRKQKMTELLHSVGSKLSKTESAIAHLM